MKTIWEYALLAIAFTQVSSYTLMSPKIYSRSIPTSNLGWSNLVQQPYRSCHGRYFNEPYFAAGVQSPEYILTQEPYSPPMDDVDYYSNYMYFVPTANRRMSYYDQPMVDVPDEIQDYDDDSSPNNEEDDDDGISESRRAWWLEKNVAPNEDTYYDTFNEIDEMYGNKGPKPTKKPRQKPKESRKIASTKSRYAGIDGFGRKKDKELVFGNFKTNPRRAEEHTVYGIPVNSQHDDVDVRELKSLAKESSKEESPTVYRGGDVSLADWSSGNAKRDTNSAQMGRRMNENSSIKEKLVSSLSPAKTADQFSAYNEGGQINIQQPSFEEKWGDYAAEEPSVFDTIKKLLALEDKIDQTNKIHKRKSPNTKSAETKTTTKITTGKPFPDFDSHSTLSTTATTSTTKISKNRRRSAPSVKIFDRNSNSIYTDEDSLVNQLNGLRHRTS